MVCLLLGGLALALGGLHYLLFRRACQLAVVNWLGLEWMAPSIPLLGRPFHGLGYLFWASFPSLAAGLATVLLFTPLFKPREIWKLCLGVVLAFAFFEALQAAPFIPGPAGPGGGRFDPLDLAALALGACSAAILAARLRRRTS